MIFTVKEQTRLTDTVYRLTLTGDTSAITRPGQFVQIQLPGFYLRRPISVCDWDVDPLTLIYKVVGEGTKAMTALKPGAELDLLTGLGNGFDTSLCGDKPLLVGGGVGLPPMYGLCKALLREGKHPSVVMGFNTAAEVFLEEEFRTLGVPVVVTTADGSRGVKGFVTAALPELDFDSTCACGPEPMLKALYNATDKPGQYSFEARMACGFGACMGCTCKTKYGAKRICKDGPVLQKEEIVW